MEALKAELAARKRKLQEQKSLIGPKKYIRRGELEELEEGNLKEEDKKESPEKQKQVIASSEDVEDAPELPRTEVFK